ncbi:MAG: hypothetical protein KAW12_20720, partial [Candidatus Aminicenantes bacterium]|nr:hypothetical protein [Candidatus Aminicenantes bacterium]
KLNQYTRFDEWGMSYDKNGNAAQKGAQHFIYDYRNRLISSESPNATINYKYDPFGRRVEKTTGSSTTKYFYDFNQVIEERDSSNQVLKQYVYGNGVDEILRVDKYESGNPIPYYYHTNAIGSITAITDSSGNLVERISYDTFGMPTITGTSGEDVSTSTIGNEYLFQGRRYDRETNLYYYRARHYDPIMGRFLQNDPMGYTDSMNLYQGFGMNPVNFVDPWGKKIKVTGSTGEKKDFSIFVEDVTGYKILIKRKGDVSIVGQRNQKKGNRIAAGFFYKAIQMKQTIQFDLISNVSTIVLDGFIKKGLAKVDIDDFLSIQNTSDINFAAALFTHLLAEQMYAVKNNSGIRPAHNYAIKSESSIFNSVKRTAHNCQRIYRCFTYWDSNNNVVKTYRIGLDQKQNFRPYVKK